MMPYDKNLPQGMRWIRGILVTNAVLCAAGGVLAICLSGRIADWLGWHQPSAVINVAIGLFVFALLLAWSASMAIIPPRLVLFLSFIDLLWVAGCVVVLAGQWTLTGLGIGLALVVALGDGIFAICEASYYWRNRGYRRDKS